MDTTNLGVSVSACACLNIDPKVTCVTNSDTASFFIPQPPPQQQLATMLPTCNPHHHKHSQLPTNHNNCLITTLNDHMPTSPASTTMSALSTLPTATSCNPHHLKQPQLPKSVNHPIDNHVQRRPGAANDSQHPTSNIDRPATMKTANNDCQTTSTHERQQQVHPWPQGSTGQWAHVTVSNTASMQHRLMRDDDDDNSIVIVYYSI